MEQSGTMKILPLNAIAAPQANKIIYADGGIVSESNNEQYGRFCTWAASSGFNDPEYLLPQLQIDTDVTPFLFEQRFVSSGGIPPTRNEIDTQGPWFYNIEWGDSSTGGGKNERDSWLVHRYRASMFRNLTASLLGDGRANLTLLDVACSSGVTALDFAEQGFRHVLGLELREHSVRQANFLKRTFSVKNIDFSVEDARNIANYNADVVFCGGLLYHVIFPVQLVEDLFKATDKFLILDSLCNNHPFSGFHLVDNVDVRCPLEGDTVVQLMPTYRAIIDLLHAAGFRKVYEILGSYAPHVLMYSTRSIRSFLAIKPGVEVGNL